jgi:Domain of Unknown Function (DUF748)
MRRPKRAWPWLTGLGAIVVIVVLSVGYFVDEPIRRRMERELNAQLEGYSVRVGAADFHLIGFGLDLEDLVIVQDANPDPPVARIPRFGAGVQWRQLLRARLVADVVVDRPKIRLNRQQEEHEAKDAVPVEERGWQEAVEATYPLKINEFKVADGDVTYVESGFRPLRLTEVNVRAGNIRNVRSAKHVYPSDLHVDAKIFDSATLVVDGRADFLAVPHAGVKTRFDLSRLPLDYLEPIARRYHASLHKGVLSARGEVEYAPGIEIVELEDATLRGADIEYLHRGAARDEQNAVKVAAAVKDVAAADPHLQTRAQRVRITDSRFAYREETVTPPYRVFFDVDELLVEQFSNQAEDPPAFLTIKGRFMGSGPTRVWADFRPGAVPPEFDVRMRIEDTDLRTLNDVFRAHGGFDVADGRFALFSEIAVKQGRIDGYVKPFFVDMDVYDAQQDESKGLARKAYEGIVGGVAELLTNRPRDEVATRTDLSGPLEDPKTSTLDVVLNLVRNAFFKAILPGFERRRGNGG